MQPCEPSKVDLLTFENLSILQNRRVLLAFSAGADSTALFFSLISHGIDFDIAIVNYALRSQADDEVEYAKQLAKKYNLNVYVLKAEEINKNFEYEARKIRYDFFEKLINENGYEYLLTAHHLQDRLEWMMMQLCKGAGCIELIGMKELDKRIGYTIFRPLIEKSKDEILTYLNSNNIKWFYDKSNEDKKYKRNYFRHEIVDKLIKEHSNGIKQTFRYMQEDTHELIKEVEIYEAEELSLFLSTSHKRSDIYHIDKILKSKNYMLNSSQREELKTCSELVVGRKFLVVLNDKLCCVAPFVKHVMKSSFKHRCTELKIPVKLRPYLFGTPVAFDLFSRVLLGDIHKHGKG